MTSFQWIPCNMVRHRWRNFCLETRVCVRSGQTFGGLGNICKLQFLHWVHNTHTGNSSFHLCLCIIYCMCLSISAHKWLCTNVCSVFAWWRIAAHDLINCRLLFFLYYNRDSYNISYYRVYLLPSCIITRSLVKFRLKWRRYAHARTAHVFIYVLTDACVQNCGHAHSMWRSHPLHACTPTKTDNKNPLLCVFRAWSRRTHMHLHCSNTHMWT